MSHSHRTSGALEAYLLCGTLSRSYHYHYHHHLQVWAETAVFAANNRRSVLIAVSQTTTLVYRPAHSGLPFPTPRNATLKCRSPPRVRTDRMPIPLAATLRLPATVERT